MATTRIAQASWHGRLQDGHGEVELASSGAGTFETTWPSRAEEPAGRTSPEELIAAAHATCLSMALSHALVQAGATPERINTRAEVDFAAGQGITGIRLTVRARVADIDEARFQETARSAKENCPVSKALAGTSISLDATLE